MDSERSLTAEHARSRANATVEPARQSFAAYREPARRLEEQLLSVTLPGRLVFVVGLVLGGWALGVYYVANITLLQGDSVGHLFVARRTIDSITPSFTQLGAIWLPLPHLLMLPTIWSDTMWRTGLAGSIVSVLAFAGAAVYIHRLVSAVSGSGLAGLLAAAIFATNPNMLYMQSTPMTEPLTIFVVAGSAYHLLRWVQDDRSLDLFLSAMFMLAASLTRYEAWVTVPIGVAVVVLATWRRHRAWPRVEAYAIVWLVFPLYGIALWMLYSQVIFGDFLNFTRGDFTGAALASHLEAQGLLPYKNHPLLASATYGWSVIDTLGVPLVLAGVAGFGALCVSKVPLQIKLAATLPLWIFVFEVASLTNGGSGMATPHASPPSFENTRYGLLMLPAAVIAAGALVRPLRSFGIVLLLAVLLPQLFVLAGPMSVASVAERDSQLDQPALASQWKSANFPFLSGDRPIVVTDAAHQGGFLNTQNGAGDFLRSHANDGRILISTARNDGAAVMMRAHLDVSRFVHEGNKPYFTDELAQFGTHADWIVFEAQEERDALRPLMARAYPSGFELVFDDGHYQVFEKAQLSTYLARPPGIPRGATMVQEERLLGSITGDPSIPENRLYGITGADCPFGVLTVHTTRANIYAETPCADWFTPDVAGRLTDTPARFALQVQPTVQLTIELPSGDPISVSPRRIWVEMTDKPVPADALPIVRQTTIGSLAAGADAIDARRTASVTCDQEVLSYGTDRETVYAEYPCAELPAGLADSSSGQRVAFEITPGSDAPLRIERGDDTALELPTGRVWVLPVTPRKAPTGAVLLTPGIAIGEDGTEQQRRVSCQDNGITMETTSHVLFIETPCGAVEGLASFNSRPVTLSMTSGDDPALVVNAGEAGSLEVPASRVWVRALHPAE